MICTKSGRLFRIILADKQFVEVCTRDPIVREQVMAILMCVQALDAQGAQVSAWHTPGNVVTGIDEDASRINIGYSRIIGIGINDNLEGPAILLCGCLRKVCQIGAILFRGEKLLVCDLALLLQHTLADCQV